MQVILNGRNALDLFLWFQTLSLLTENFQEGNIDLAVNAMNGVFLCVFLLLLKEPSTKASSQITLLSALLFFQLLIPATLSLAFAGSGILIAELVKLAAWLTTLVFSIKFHSDPERVLGTLRTVQACAFFVLAALLLFTLTGYGDTAYDLGILHLGSIQNEPAVSMFALALFVSFFVRLGRVRQLIGLCGLLLVLALLFKRSSILAAVALLMFGSPYLLRSVLWSRILIWIAIPAILLTAASSIEFESLIHGSGIISTRLEDFQKWQQFQDTRYLGSGRLGLLQIHWESYLQGSLMERLIGRFFSSYEELLAGGYLGSGLIAAPHNDAVEMIIRGGVFGLLTYLALLGTIGLRLSLWGRRPTDTQMAAAHFVGVAAALVYVMHIVIGVVFKVQFMIVISILVGMAIRIAYEERLGSKVRHTRRD